MPSLWIVHRSPRLRAALERLVGLASGVVSGEPGDPRFASAELPDVVLLGLDAPSTGRGSWERELSFASQIRTRAPGALWLITGPAAAEPYALALFDNLRVEFYAYPPDPRQLRTRVAEATREPPLAPLSERSARDALAARFARWYGDLDLPALLRALDPTLSGVPVLIRGEPGTGRGLLVRYLHTFGMEGAVLVHVPCHESLGLTEIEARARDAALAGRGITLWLEDAERLPGTTQQQLEAWIQGTASPRGLRTPFVRFVATTTPDGAPRQLRASLLRALSTLQIDLPPLRERANRIAAIASETLADWCHERRIPPRRLGEDSLAVLEECAWPGNLYELESVVRETAVAAAGEPITSTELRCKGRPLAPLGGKSPEEPRVAAPSESPVGESGGPATPAQAPPAPPLEGAAPATEPAAPTPAAQPEPAPEPPAVVPSARALPAQTASGASPADVPPPPVARLAAAVGREMRDPLLTLQELARLPAERFEDASFREQLAGALGRDAARVGRLAERIEALGELGRPRQEAVDVVALLEELLAPHEETIRARRLLVLKELDATRPHALADAEKLRLALGSLVDKAFDLVPDRGDLYVASRHHAGRSGSDTIRILIRFHSPDRAANLPLLESSLEVVVAESVIQAMRGRLAVSATEGEEALILLDLPAAAPAPSP